MRAALALLVVGLLILPAGDAPEFARSVTYGGIAYQDTTYRSPMMLTIQNVRGTGPYVTDVRVSYERKSYLATATLDQTSTGKWLGGAALRYGGNVVGKIQIGSDAGLTTWAGTFAVGGISGTVNFIANSPLIRDEVSFDQYVRTHSAKERAAVPGFAGKASPKLSDPGEEHVPSYIDPLGNGTDSNVQGVSFWNSWFYGEAVGSSHLAPNGSAYWSNRVWLTQNGYNYFAGAEEQMYGVWYTQTATNSSAGFGVTPTGWVVHPNAADSSPVSISIGYSFGGVFVGVSFTPSSCACGSNPTASWTYTNPKFIDQMLYGGEGNSNGVGSSHFWYMQSSTGWGSSITMRTDLNVTTIDTNSMVWSHPTSIYWTIVAN
jgi:hypothetical protein